MLVTVSYKAEAVVTKKRARTRADVDLRVERTFLVPEVDPSEAPVLVVSPTADDFLGFRYDWRSHAGSWWRDVGGDALGPLARERVAAWRNIGLDHWEIEKRARKNRETVIEDEVREVHESNADELAGLLAGWIEGEFVAVDGALCRREHVPVVTASIMSRTMRYAQGDRGPAASDFPVCLWDMSPELPKKYVKRHGHYASVVSAVDAWLPVGAPEFDRDNALLVHHAAGISDGAVSPKTLVLADMLRRPVSNRELIDAIRRSGASDAGKDGTFLEISRRHDPPRRRRFPLAGPVEGTRIVFALGHQQHDRIQVEAGIPRIDPSRAPATAVLSAGDGAEPCVLRHAEGCHLVPVLPNSLIGGGALRLPEAFATGWPEDRGDIAWRLGELGTTLGVLRLPDHSANPEGCASALAAFARDHLVDVGGAIHVRSGEPHLAQSGSRVEIRATRRDPRASLDAAMAGRKFHDRDKSNVFGVCETDLMEAVARTDEHPPKEEDGGRVLVSVETIRPDLFPLRAGHAAGVLVLERALKRFPVGSMPPRSAAAATAACAAALALGRRPFIPPTPEAMERAHAAFATFVEEISTGSLHSRISGTPAFAALRDGVLPYLAGAEPAREDEEVYAFGM